VKPPARRRPGRTPDTVTELRALLAAMTDVILVIDADGRYLKIAPSGASLLYRPPEELLGKTVHEVFPKAEADFFVAQIRRALELRGPVQVEYSLPIAGNQVFFDASVAPLDADTVVWVARDATERKRAEQRQAAMYRIAEAVNAARGLEDLLRTVHHIIGELMPARNFFIALYDPGTETVTWPYFVDENDPPPPPRRLGRGLTEYVLRTGRPALVTPDVERALAESGEVELTGEPAVDWLGIPLIVESRTIGVLVVQSYAEGTRYGERELELLRFVSTQVAVAIERKRAEERYRESETTLRGSEEKYRALVDGVKDVIFALAPDGEVTALNLAFEDVTGWPREEWLGRPFVELLHVDDVPRALELLRMAPRGQQRPTAQLRVRTSQVDYRLGEVHTSVQLRDGEVVAVLGIVRDITDRVRLEAQLRQAQKMEAVGRLAGGVAHDFNNLLTAISSYSELLLTDLAREDPRRADVEEIRKATERAAGLTRQLLAFSRRQVLQPKVVDLNAVIAGAERLLRRLIGEDIALVTRLDPELGAVKADAGQLEQVIINLAVNAREAMRDGGTLTLETANAEIEAAAQTAEQSIVPPGSYVLLRISDTGAGMDAETKRHLFEPFFTTREKGKGTGLGLATVYGIVKQSGGFIWVDSEPSQGAAFRIFLPRVDEAAPAVERVVRTVEPRAVGTETILLVEDEDAVRAVARESLRRQGYAVLEAPDAESALKVSGGFAGRIELLLTDVVMPGLSGRVLADRLATQRPDTKVLFMSGYTDDAIVRHGVLEPGLNYLQKPFTPDVLAHKVRAILDAPSAA
jgi:PAS domain S-box-containing protein